MVKGGKNESNTFGEGWGMFPPTPSPLPQNAGFGGYLGGGGRRRRLGAALVGMSEVKKRRVGEKRPARAQDIGLVAPALMARQACRASACGAIGTATSSPTRRTAGSGCQRGNTVAPVHVARQRLSVAPCGMVRPNGQCHEKNPNTD